MVLVAMLLLLMINQGAARFHVNETVGEFRISFEVKDDVNLIMKGWNITDIFGPPPLGPSLKIKDSFMVMTTIGKHTLDDLSGVFVLIMDKPVQTIDVENDYLKNSTDSYIRVFDRIIDGHKGIYVLQGDGPEDLDMDHIGLYWLDETEDGTATELVLVASDETETIPEAVINTVHVEKI